MRVSTSAVLTAVIAAGLLSTGCVSKGMFRKNVESTDARVGAVETAVEANERRIGDMKGETDRRLSEMDGSVDAASRDSRQALSAAQTAQQTAEAAALGRLLWTVTLSDESVKFAFGDSDVPAEAAAALDDLSDRIKSYGKAVYIEIEGHTDNIGGEDYNMTLGETRANAVRHYLNANGGIPLHAMNTISFGESRPVAGNETREGRAQNRRVVIRVLE